MANILYTYGENLTLSGDELMAYDKIRSFPDAEEEYDFISLTITSAVSEVDLAERLGSVRAQITLLSGVSYLRTGSGNDYIIGSTANDGLDGGDGHDTIEDLFGDSGGVAAISGGAGNDAIAVHYENSDLSGWIDGGDGNDRLQINGTDLGSTTIRNIEMLDTGGRQISGTIEQFESFERIMNYNFWYPINTLEVSLLLKNGGIADLSEELDARRGIITASAFGNIITTGNGNDLVYGGNGNDTLNGVKGDDHLFGNSGNDMLNGGDGNDVLFGDDKDRLLDDDGHDILNGGDGNDLLEGGDGQDSLNGGNGNDAIYDTFSAEGGIADISGGSGDDVISMQYYGTDLSGSIQGGDGNDRLTFLGDDFGNVTFSGIETLSTFYIPLSGTVQQFESFDTIVMFHFNMPTSDSLKISITLTNGGDLDLSTELGTRASAIFASKFGNAITAGGGNDDISGSESNDTLKGGAGNDYLSDYYGGSDTAVYSGTYSAYTVNANVINTVSSVNKSIITSAAEGTDTLYGIEFARFSDGIYDLTTKVFTEGFNTTPANIRLSSTKVSEDTKKWTTLGLFSATDADGDTLTYALTDDAGGKFAINGRRFITADTFDYETDTFHDITVAVSDGTTTVEKDFRITIGDIYEAPTNAAPTNLALSRSYVKESSAAITSIGLFSATDAEGHAIKWKLLDNADSFRIVGNKLQTTTSLDYEAIPDHELTITVQATDSLGFATVQDFTIEIRDVFEPGGLLI